MGEEDQPWNSRGELQGDHLPHESRRREPIHLLRKGQQSESRLVERFEIEPFSDFFSQNDQAFSTARSLLYRRHIFQENTRWEALGEMYKMHVLLHRSDLNIPAKLLSNFPPHFSANFPQTAMIQHFSNEFFCAEFDENVSEVRRMF